MLLTGAYAYRIHAEEELLAGVFGRQYEEYHTELAACCGFCINETLWPVWTRAGGRTTTGCPPISPRRRGRKFRAAGQSAGIGSTGDVPRVTEALIERYAADLQQLGLLEARSGAHVA